MIFGYLMLVIAITISAIAAWYSVAGLVAIFSAAVIPVMIMGGALEAGKIVATVWLHNNWHRAGWVYKTYLVPAIVALMLLTSMGIFGFLSKGHADQSIVSGDAMSKVAIYDEKIAAEKETIAQAKRALEQMNAQVDQMLSRTDSERGTDKAVIIRKQQAKERAALQAEITRSQKAIQQLQAERAPLAAEFRKVEAEVGPIKYIAALIYGDNPDQNLLEAAVRWVIILIVIVFDPLALCLILAANKQLEWARAGRGGWVRDEEPAEKYPADDGPLTASQLEQTQQSAAEPNYSQEDFFARAQFAAQAADALDEQNRAQEANTALSKIDKSEPDLDIPVLENEETWAQRVIDEHRNEEMASDIAELYVLKDEDIAAYNKERLISKFDKVASSNEEESVNVTAIIQDTPPQVITVEQQELIDNAANIIEELNVELQRKESDLQLMQQKVEEIMLQMEDLAAQRNVEHQRANNLHAQLIDLLHGGNAKKISVDLAPIPDNVPDANFSNTGFGSRFPAAANKGDSFVRTDHVPSKLFKFNGLQWIEIDKTKSDAYVYNEAYIDYLIEKLKTGEYDSDDLSESEHEQIAQHLQERNGKS